MEPKDRLDLFGVAGLTGFALLLAFNQVVIKVSNGGFQPVFLAGLRSLGALVLVLIVMRLRRVDAGMTRGVAPLGVLLGLVFAAEFICLFSALDMTSVSRASVIFYSMPFWAALGARLFLGDSLTPGKVLGLAAAFCGMALAIFDPAEAREGHVLGDFAALGASIGWAATLLLIKGTRLSALSPDQQLLWQVLVSAPVLLIAAFFFGDLLREVAPLHVSGLIFQILLVAFGFQFWFWLLKLYPAGAVASFSFLSPVISVALGWLLLGEVVDVTLLLALVLVVIGLVLTNR